MSTLNSIWGMAFNAFSEFWFFRFQPIFVAAFARLFDSLDVIFISPYLITSNDAFVYKGSSTTLSSISFVNSTRRRICKRFRSFDTSRPLTRFKSFLQRNTRNWAANEVKTLSKEQTLAKWWTESTASWSIKRITANLLKGITAATHTKTHTYVHICVAYNECKNENKAKRSWTHTNGCQNAANKRTEENTHIHSLICIPKTKKIFGQLMLQINSKTTHYKCDLIAPLAPPNLCPHFVT